MFNCAFIFLMASAAYAQNPIQIVNTMTKEELVNALVDNDCAQVSNVSITGSDGTLERSYAYFTADSNFPFGSGIILSTGYAISAPGPNDSILSDGFNNWGGDQDLQQQLGITGTLNATIMEFDFIPSTNHISFDYIFASEEYTGWPDQGACNYSDGFAFLLREAGSTGAYQNLAVIPGTDTPVQVTTVRGNGTACPPANAEYFDAFNGVDHPTNFNGQTVVLTAQANVTAGTLYHIKLVIADQGDALYDAAVFLKANSFGSAVDLGDDRIVANGTALCDGTTLQLNATIPDATGYQWYNSGTPINGATNAFYTVTAPGIYSVEAQITPTCAARGEITIEYDPPIDLDPYLWNQCDDDNDGLSAYYLFRIGGELVNNHEGLSVVSWHLTTDEARDGINDLLGTALTVPFYNTTADQVIYARVKNEGGCIAIIPVTLSMPPFTIFDPAPIEVCDTNNDGIYNFNFTQLSEDIQDQVPPGTGVLFFKSYEDALGYQFPIMPISSYSNTTPGDQTIYIGLHNQIGCYAIMGLQLIVHTFGDEFADEEVILCEGSTLALDAGSGYSSYIWNTSPAQDTQTITIDATGTYTVTVTDSNGCEGSKTFTIVLSAPAESVDFDINDFSGNDNSVTINASGIGNYEYSMDNIIYQESNVFNHLPGGENTFYIRDSNGCLPVFFKTLYLLDYPTFFTPNGDGINDTWRIPYSYFRPTIEVSVFDRYGKFITKFRGNQEGWDGTHNGTPLPATDYWFVIELENGEKIRGHLAMVR
ncbi:choice-of-anchor L domain-containing protein [Flavobacterium sp.]